MSSRTLWCRPAMIAALTVVVFVSAVKADFTLVSQNLTINQHDRVADFSLTFNQPPDFTTVDAYGRPADSFQYEIDGDFQTGSSDNFTSDLTAIVRGDEIHLGNTIRIREPSGDGGPDSGGWGPVVAAVPFRLIGDDLSFSVPTSDLGYTGKYYQYEVLALTDGATTYDQNVTVIPLPSTLSIGIVGLAFTAAAGFWIRRAKVGH
jgi:hypothetical protein